MSIRMKRLSLEKCSYALVFDPTSKIAIFAEFHVRMELSDQYPFHPPVVYYKDVMLNKYFMNLFTQHALVKRFHLKIPCVCCSSLLNAWSPCYKLEDVLKEVERNRALETLLDYFPTLPFDDLVTNRVLCFLL